MGGARGPPTWPYCSGKWPYCSARWALLLQEAALLLQEMALLLRPMGLIAPGNGPIAPPDWPYCSRKQPYCSAGWGLLLQEKALLVKFLLAQTSFSRQSHGDSTRPKEVAQQPEQECDMSCACVTAVCTHMIATLCASFVGTWGSVYNHRQLVSVIFDQCELWVIPSTNS